MELDQGENPLEYVIVVRDNPYPIANHNLTLVLGGFEMTLSIGNVTLTDMLNLN